MASRLSQKEKIVKAVKKTALSATKIANELGFSKAAKIKQDLEDLVNEGLLEIDSSGRFDVYKAATKSSKSKSVSKTSDNQEVSTVEDGERVDDNLPEASDTDLRGFAIANIRYKGKRMKKVTTPDGKKIRLGPEEKLIVINGKPKFVISSPEELITSIRKYALDNDLTVFNVKDMKQNKKISNEKDVQIKDNHIMFLNIQKHNKAA